MFYLKKIISISFFISVLSYSMGADRSVKWDEKSKMLFWNHFARGANIFNKNVSREDIRAAKAYGITFIRLVPDKFKSESRDFLLGNADQYCELVRKDLEKLKKILDMCAEEKMPVVLAMLSLPGSRWKQNNEKKDDLRLWSDEKFQEQSAKFWKDVAKALKNHPALVGYNILNEPHMERFYDKKAIHLHEVNQQDVQEKLFKFYELIIKNIRVIDKNTPIVLDSSSYADARTFKHLKVQRDPHTLYSFHMYEPYEYTNHKTNKEKYAYPGTIGNKHWDKGVLKKHMKHVIDFQKTNNIPSNRILVGEFGGNRKTKGLAAYFHDLVSIFKEQGWHFAFYAFREDSWDGMDYELGEIKLPKTYWESLEKGQVPLLDRKETSLFKVLISR